MDAAGTLIVTKNYKLSESTKKSQLFICRTGEADSRRAGRKWLSEVRNSLSNDFEGVFRFNLMRAEVQVHMTLKSFKNWSRCSYNNNNTSLQDFTQPFALRFCFLYLPLYVEDQFI